MYAIYILLCGFILLEYLLTWGYFFPLLDNPIVIAFEKGLPHSLINFFSYTMDYCWIYGKIFWECHQ